VYSAGGNPASHYSTVAPIALSGASVLNLNNVSWLEIQHLQIDWFDAYGVQVQEASDHLWLANMVANSEVENGAVPLGFYVHPDAAPADIHLWNADANMNYDGFRFDYGSGTHTGLSFDVQNCRAYGNRAYGIVDNVGGAVSYDYCHLYANNLATAVTVDTSGTPGPTAGIHNVPAETPPWIREWHRWPAYTTVSYDDPGLVQYSDTYINSLLPIMTAKAIPLSIAVVTGGSYSQSIVSEVQGWINAGWDVNTHSISHEYWNPPAASCGANGPFPVPCHAFENLQYTGTIASSVTLNIAHPTPGHATLTVTTNPDDPAADINWDVTPAAPGQASNGLDTLGGILSTNMKHSNDEIGFGEAQPPVVVRLGIGDFQQKVLEKLGRLEAMVDMIVGSSQPGRMKLAEDRLVALEKNDLRRTVYDRIVIAALTSAITLAISAIIALRSYLGLK
jgi:hypothetical protein